MTSIPPVPATFTGQLPLGYQTTLSLSEADSEGNVVAPSTPPVWNASDNTVNLVPAADGQSCVVQAVSVGTATVGTITAIVTNADGTTATGTIGYEVTADDITTVTVTGGTITPIAGGATPGVAGAAQITAQAQSAAKFGVKPNIVVNPAAQTVKK